MRAVQLGILDRARGRRGRMRRSVGEHGVRRPTEAAWGPRPPAFSTPELQRPAVTAITSAFGDPTPARHLPLRPRRRADGVTASEVAERFDLHPNVARHHLDKLAAGGYLEVVDRPHRGRAPAGRRSATGSPSAPRRPRVRRPPRRPARHPPRQTLARLPAGEAEAMAEEVGVEYGRAMAATAAAAGRELVDDDVGRSFRSALHTVADALTAHGFAAHAESRRRTPADRLRALPVRRRRHRAPGDLRRRPRHGARDARRPVRRRVGGDGGVGRPGRRRLRHDRRVTCGTTSTTRRRRRCGPRPRDALVAVARRRVGRPRPGPRRGARRTGRGRGGARGRRRAPRRPVPRGRVHQRRHRGDRGGVLGSGRARSAPGRSPRSSTRPCGSRPRSTAT